MDARCDSRTVDGRDDGNGIFWGQVETLGLADVGERGDEEQ